MELVTPAIAAAWLENTSGNRRLSETHALNLARIMSRGEWMSEASDPIRFDLTGAMIDGQHRCRGVVISGVPIKAVVVRDLPATAFSILGQQMGRKGSDLIHHFGFKNCRNTAAVLSMAWAVDRGGRFRDRPTHQQIAVMAQTLPGLHQIFDGLSGEANKLWNQTVYGYLRWVTDGLADDFLQLCALPANLAADHPCMALHRFLIEQRVARAKRTTDDVVAMAIKAFNAYCVDKAVGVLRYRQHRPDQSPEKFPTLRKDVAPRLGLTLRLERQAELPRPSLDVVDQAAEAA